MESNVSRDGFGPVGQFVIASLLMAGSFGLVTAFALVVTRGFVQAFS